MSSTLSRPPRRASWQRRLLGAAGCLAVLLAEHAALRRVEVAGESMQPALAPGDRLVVVRLPRWWPLREGDVVAIADPRAGSDRVLVKRVQRVHRGAVEVLGDRRERSTDSRSFGPVPRRALIGRAVYRYHPSHRAGRLR